MKKVSAAPTMRSAAASSSPRTRTAAGADASAYTASRGWMYFGQLPKLWPTRTSRPAASMETIRPFMRLRRRVCACSPSNPIGAPCARCCLQGSCGGAAARIRNRSGAGEYTKPGGPANTEAQGWPWLSRVAA